MKRKNFYSNIKAYRRNELVYVHNDKIPTRIKHRKRYASRFLARYLGINTNDAYGYTFSENINGRKIYVIYDN